MPLVALISILILQHLQNSSIVLILAASFWENVFFIHIDNAVIHNDTGISVSRMVWWWLAHIVKRPWFKSWLG